MMEWKKVFEDGDYEIHQSTNHADPDRIAVIYVDHALCENAAYAALIQDQAENEIEDSREFFGSWDEARKYLECNVTMKIRIESAA